MAGENGYWQRYWRKRLTRRGLLRGTALGAAGLTAAAIVGCGEGEEEATPTPVRTTPAATATPAPTPTLAPGETPAPTPPPTPTPVVLQVPPPPKYSDLPAQKLMVEHHWSALGNAGARAIKGIPSTSPRMGGVVASAGLVTNATTHPNDQGLPLGQWSYCYDHSGLLGLDWDLDKNPDLLPITTEYGALSQSFETPDAQTFIFRLRPNITFHNIPPANGAPLTVDDIRATYFFYRDDTIFHTQFFNTITSIEETEPGVITIKHSEPNIPFLGTVRNPSYFILNAKHLEEGDEGLNFKTIGTGPFQLKVYEPNVKRIFERNPNWWWGKDPYGNQYPYLDGIAHIGFRDPAGIVAGMRTKQIDYFRPTNVQEAERLRDDLDLWLQISVGTCACVSPILAFSHRTPELQNEKVRQALSMAVDRQAILDNVYGGGGMHHGWIPHYFRGHIWPPHFDTMGPWYKFDPEGAKNMLRDAGVTPLKVTFHLVGSLTAGGGAQADDATESILGNIQALGDDIIQLNLNAFESGRARTGAAYGGEWTGLMMFTESTWGMNPDTAIQAAVTGSPRNFTGMSDPKIDQWFKDQRAAVDPDERRQIWIQLEKYVNQEKIMRGVQLPGPYAYGAWRKYYRNMIEGSAWWGNGGGMTHSFQWWLDENAPSRDVGSL